MQSKTDKRTVNTKIIKVFCYKKVQRRIMTGKQSSHIERKQLEATKK